MRRNVLLASLVVAVLAGAWALATYPRWGGRQTSHPPAPEAAAADTSLAGQWRGQLVVGEGRTSELVVDLGMASARWVGQFDLDDFGVEDYPVGVTRHGRSVALHLSAAQIDFEGTLSAAGDVLAGIASMRGESDSLVLERAGDAQLSSEFLALERLADDSTRIEHLSGDAAELRRRFNDDRALTRLVMLLSPS